MQQPTMEWRFSRLWKTSKAQARPGESDAKALFMASK
jgi:hypothetical protein